MMMMMIVKINLFGGNSLRKEPNFVVELFLIEEQFVGVIFKFLLDFSACIYRF